jgi:hypothetical protein
MKPGVSHTMIILAEMELTVNEFRRPPLLHGWTRYPSQSPATATDQANIHNLFSVHVSLDSSSGLPSFTRLYHPEFDVLSLLINGIYHRDCVNSVLQSIGETVGDSTHLCSGGAKFTCALLAPPENTDATALSPNLRALYISNWYC